MELFTRIYDLYSDEADRSVIDKIYLGLGYTAVTLLDGRIGLCATLLDSHKKCTVNIDSNDYEGRSALNLLRNIRGENILSRVMAVALVNAFTQPFARSLVRENSQITDLLHLSSTSKVAMIGHFEPVVQHLLEKEITVQSFDIGKGLGEQEEFYLWAQKEAHALILTATSIPNGTMEEVLHRIDRTDIPIMIMGPSTIMDPEIYEGLSITHLAGTVVDDTTSTLKSIRNGKGTQEIHKHAHKVTLCL